MYNSKIAKEKYVSFVKLFNEIISSTVVWENDMPMFVLFAGAGCSASSEVALGGRMVQIIQKYSFLKENEDGIYLLAKWKRNEETLEAFIQKYENEIDEEQFNSYVNRKRKQFAEKYDNKELKVELLKSLPLSFQKLIKEEKNCTELASLEGIDLEEIWGKYKDKLLGDLEYGFWMQEYSPESNKIQELMEEFIENKTPAFEYYLLADLINQGMLFNVFTTNFDNFIHEAMSFLGTRARVCIYDDKASSISYNRKKPNIIKLHGEYLYNNTKNYINETHDLGECLNEKFKEALQRFGMIVVGYQGNDYSIMHILEELKKERPYPLYWCIREVDLEKISWRVVELINNTPMSYIVPIKDFRTFVVELWNYWSRTHNVEQSSIKNVVKKAENIQMELSKVIREQSHRKKFVADVSGIGFAEYFKDQFGLVKSPFTLWKNEGINSFNIDYDYTSYYPIEKARMFIAEMPSYKQKVVDCIINLLAEHIYMTTKQIYLLLFLKGFFYGDRDDLLKLLKNLKDNRILAMYQFKSTLSKKDSFLIISLDYLGAKIYKAKNKRNANWNLSTVTNTTVYDMKRILSANQLITEAEKWADILFEIKPKLGGTKNGLNAVRPTAKVLFSLNEDEYFGMVECIREFSGWQDELERKLKRYDIFLSSYRGYKNPVLILCGECVEQVREIYLVLDNYFQVELSNYRESNLNYSNVWFTFDRNLLNKKFEYSFFRLYTQNEQIYVTDIDISNFVTHDYTDVLPIQFFKDKKQNIEQREKIIFLLKEFFKELETSYKLIRFSRMGEFSVFLSKNNLTLQEFGYTKIYDLLNHLSENYYKFSIEEDGDNFLECFITIEEQKSDEESIFLEEICKSEERKLRLESIMSLVYKESKQESLDVNTLKQVLFNVESNIEIYGEIEEYLHKLPMIFHTFVYGDKEYVKLTLDMEEDKEKTEEDKEKTEETFVDILKSLMVNQKKGARLFYLTELGQYIHRAGINIAKYGFKKLGDAVASCKNIFDVYQLNETIEMVQFHQSYVDILLPYEIVRNQEKIENNDSECFALQIYKPNYLSQYIEKIIFNREDLLGNDMDSEARKYEMVSNQEGIENNNSECFALQIYRPNYLLQHIKNVNYDREDILSNDMGGKPRKNVKKYKVSNVKELLNIMIKIIFKYDPTNKRINLVQMEQLLLENNINIKELGFSDLKQFAELVHNTIYCYSFGNNEFLRINTEDKKRAYNMKKKRYRRNF
ncbi:SIR2 family protein [Thomasclavelia cocleata]|uniref:SIR2 family protein n=1 Tax=Thomasclavelia cocleata TaxID=69824 RepID=UPI0025AD6D0C|nr:SIR2 family protein [Thomasclavelia cocleata]